MLETTFIRKLLRLKAHLSGAHRVAIKSTRFVLLKNPWNLRPEEKERLSNLVRWNLPIVRAWYLKESFQLFWEYKQPARAQEHVRRWMHSAMGSRLEPFKNFVRLLREHLDGILANVCREGKPSRACCTNRANHLRQSVESA